MRRRRGNLWTSERNLVPRPTRRVRCRPAVVVTSRTLPCLPRLENTAVTWPREPLTQ
jgi:hypothetical protein